MLCTMKTEINYFFHILYLSVSQSFYTAPLTLATKDKFMATSTELYLPMCDTYGTSNDLDSAKQLANATSFFRIVLRLYNLFFAALRRCAILKEHVKHILKSWSETRWESSVNSNEPLQEEIRSFRFQICAVVWFDNLSNIKVTDKLLLSANAAWCHRQSYWQNKSNLTEVSLIPSQRQKNCVRTWIGEQCWSTRCFRWFGILDTKWCTRENGDNIFHCFCWLSHPVF